MIRLKGMVLNLVMILLLVGIEAKRSDRAQIEAAALERMTAFADVRVKMNSLFDSFDDVITAQAVRVSEGLVVRDDNFNEKFVELIEEAEDLDDRIGQMVRGLDDDGDDDDMDDDDIGSLSRMQVSAAFMEKRASSLMDDVIKTTESSEEDASLRENMATVSEYTKDVLWALKSVETKRKVKGWRMESAERTERQDKKNNRYSIRESLDKYNEAAEDDSIDSDINDDEYDYNIQRDDATTNNDNRFRSSSYLRKEHLTGTPVAGQIRRSSYHRSSSRTQSSSKQNETSSSTSPERDSKTATSRHYQNLNDRYGYKQQVGGSRDPRRRRPQPDRVANIRESTSDRNGHYFDMSTLGNYLRTCSDCAGLTERAQCPMYSEMEELKKWSEELQDLLSYGCAKPAHCKAKGICCVNRKATFRETVVKMTQMIREVHDMLDRECQEECTKDSCQRDPEWMDWSNWSGCSVSCGQGTRQRRRSCNDTMSNGRTCSGDAVGYSQCRMPSCCVDGLWSSWNSWSSCSATCGRGVQQRDRRCDGPAPNQCGRPCEGSNLDRRACESDKSCCIQGNWSGWSSWATCSVTCGQGLTSRRRQCDNPAPNHCGQTCSGTADQRRRCGNEKDCCVAGNWGSWTGWTSCSVSCGLGSKSRMRRCDNPAPNFCGQRCAGSGRDTQTCSAGACCVNGNWGQWASWEGCSATCGRGNEVRRRRCDNPPANSCGSPCPGKPSDVRICGGAACCVNGNWSPWGGWSRCSVSCGVGSQIRERQCSNPAANSCGRPCAGSGKQAKTCRQAACPPKCVNGNWAPWSGWSSCSASCGVGVRTKSRQCSNPPPNFCGTKCPGRTELTDRCQSQECCVNGNWSPWTGWSACSASCGAGVRTKSRQCNNPAPNSCGNTCGGRGELTERCENRKCCVNGNWSPWTGWSACSASCGVGVRTKSRQCNNPAPNSCGNTCAGRGELSDRCENRKCCVNGNWSPWTGWSACSATCGVGVRTKSRQCNNPAPNSCGNTCGGRGELSERCENRKCCVDGNWSQWTRWSSCSATCGYGVRTKSRQCDSPAPNHCGNTCPGRAELTDRCQNKQCCVNGKWSPWSRWSSCSVSCGGGVRSKIRECNSPAPNYCGSKCAGDSEFRENCNTRECCVDGNWSAWNDEDCRGVCTQGVKYMRRYCTDPAPNYCGKPCAGRATEECDPGLCTQECAMRQWTVWGQWSSCTRTCGQGAIRIREMQCEFLGGLQGRKDCGQESYKGCRNERKEQLPCLGLPMCNGDTTWGEWSACSATCRGNGVQTRRMMVMTFGGLAEVRGGKEETKLCSVDSPECHGPWGPWGPCSATCRGQGIRQRRTLVDLTDLGTIKANASQTQTEDCNVNAPECPTWGPWGPCTGTCRGEGVRQRRTIIRANLTDGGSIEASASQTQTDTCWYSQGPACPEWTSWSACSATCKGPGVRERILQDYGLPESQRPRKTETCFGTGPECPNPTGIKWGEWGPCSATCRGSGVRVRASLTRTYLSEGVWVEAKAVQKQTQACSGSGPECPSAPSWSTWESWCPCGCNNGQRSRRRECVQTSGATGQATKVDISHCSGEGRQEERCETRGICPECIVSCDGRPDGKYPTCSGCRDHMTCSNGQLYNGVIEQCQGTEVWDAFINKCVSPPSPSCSLKDCVSDCTNIEDGNYHHCSGCGWYVQCFNGVKRDVPCGGSLEFNQFAGKCTFERSPTCKRSVTGFGVINTNAHGQRGSGTSGANDAHAIKVDGHGGSVTHGGSVHQGGSVTHGGTVHQGGSVTHSGSVHQGGSVTHGGSVSHGSNVNRGGSFVFGGGVHQGGRVNPGGSVSQGGIITQGGFISQGGRVTHGGSVSQGGRVSQGGSVSQGGRVSQGGNVINTGSGYSGNDGNSGFSSGSHRFQGGSTHLVHRQGGNVGGTGSQTQGSRTSGWSGGSQPSSHSFKPSSSSSSSSTFLVHTGTRGGSRQSGSGQSVVSPTHKASRISLRNGRRQILGCVSSCSGSEPGRYASCQVDACNEYVVCTSGNKLRTRQCHGAKEWDDVIKKCVRRSSTCR